MNERQKTKAELIEELAELRARLSDLSDEAEAQRRIEQALQQRIAFDELVTTISSRFINLPVEEIDEGIKTALKMVGEFAGVDRSYVILLDASGEQIQAAYEWCRDEVPAQIEHLIGKSTKYAPQWFKQLHQFKTVKVTDPNKLPKAAQQERKLMADQGLQSVVLVPMRERQSLIGFVGYDTIHESRDWTEDSIALLEIIAEILVNALLRKRTEEALQQSKARYEMAITAGRVAIWRWTIDDVAINLDANLDLMLGYEDDEIERTIAGMSMHVHPDDFPKLQGKIDQMIKAQEREISFEHRMFHKDGSIRWFMTRGRVYDGDENGGPFVLGTTTDITERKLSEEATEQEHQLAVAIQDSVIALLGTLDRDEILDRILRNVGRVVPHDNVNIMLIEGDETSVIRQNPTNRHFRFNSQKYPTLKLPNVPTLQRIQKTGQPVLIDDVRKEKGWLALPGTEWIRSYLGVPIKIGDEVIGFLNVDSVVPHYFTDAHRARLEAFASQAALAIHNANLFRDMERRVRARTADLQEAHDTLKEASEVRDRFVANISHELRTPLTNIKLYHHLMEHYKEKSEAYLQTLNRETNRLERIVEDLLQFSRLEHADISAKVEEVDIQGLCLQFVEDRSALADHQGVTLVFQEEAPTGIILGDRYLLGQVLSILLTNAVNLAPIGSQVVIGAHTRTDQKGHQWTGFSVTDSGPGIDKEEQEHLFDRFFRGRATITAGIPGTGLGLSIANEIISRHDGEIEVESSGIPGEGAKFTVWLPNPEERKAS